MAIVASVGYSFDSGTTALTQALRDQTGEYAYTKANISTRVSGGPFGVGRYAVANGNWDYIGFPTPCSTVMWEGWFRRAYPGYTGTCLRFYQGDIASNSWLLHDYIECLSNSTSTFYFKAYNGKGSVLGQSAVTYLEQWYWLQARLYLHASAGTLVLKVDNELVLNLSGLDTRYFGVGEYLVDGDWGLSAPCTHVGWGSNSWNSHFADVVVKDNLGASHTDLFDARARFLSLSPNADGSDTGFAPSTGTDHYAVLDEVPFSTSDYLGATGVGLKDSSKFPNPGVTGTVVALVPYIEASKSDTATRKIKTYVRDAAGNYDYSSEISLSETNLGHSRIIYVSPTGGALSTTCLGSSGLEIGEEATV